VESKCQPKNCTCRAPACTSQQLLLLGNSSNLLRTTAVLDCFPTQCNPPAGHLSVPWQQLLHRQLESRHETQRTYLYNTVLHCCCCCCCRAPTCTLTTATTQAAGRQARNTAAALTGTPQQGACGVNGWRAHCVARGSTTSHTTTLKGCLQGGFRQVGAVVGFASHCLF
jgi:hypothetical protein